MIIEIDKDSLKDMKLLKEFISSMGNSSDSFRYYKSRDLSAVENHLFTIVLSLDNLPIGYGHLDKDGNDIWLGIAISQNYRGMGNGKVLMEYLVAKADDLKLAEIKLSVDKNNEQAIKLYKHFGFVELQEKNEVLYYSRKLSE